MKPMILQSPALERVGTGAEAEACLVAAQYAPRNHDLLYLACPFVDSENAHVTVEALDAIVGHIPGAPKYLDRAVRDPPDHLRSVVLRTRRLERDVLTGVALSRGIENHATRGIRLGLR